MGQEGLRLRIWRTLLEALEKCQDTIDLLEQLEGDPNEYIAEWEELDDAYAHMHNVRRWIGRSWPIVQRQGIDPGTPPAERVLTRQETQAALNEITRLERNES
jgi:hypothetical protein